MKSITFNELPEAVSSLFDKLDNIEQLLKMRPKASPPPDDGFLSIDEASNMLNLAKATIYGLVSANRIPYMKQGKKLYFSKATLMQWIYAGSNKTQQEFIAEVDNAIVDSKNKRRLL
jgi:excisionase family DNA binding protein